MDHELQERLGCLTTAPAQIRWCDPTTFRNENSEGASPGQYLNRFGWWVLGTTIGGNAVAVGKGDPAVYFAGHDWYFDETVAYEDLRGGGGVWRDGPLTKEMVSDSLFMLAPTPDAFIQASKNGEIDAILQRID